MATRRAFAQEDTNLQTTTVTTSRQKAYKDIDLTFTAKTDSGEIYKKTDAAAVKQAVKTLIMTNFLEKPFQPQYGGNIIGQLFELSDVDMEEELSENIRSQILQYEPRAETQKVIVSADPDRYTLDVTVQFKLINTNEVVSVTTTLSRLR
jgi:phage baseplate assembly protein W|tara:strand:- start:11646 stop:12095 length:450 start_codon:yes stop_codon:yes gene_type:complete